MRRSKRTRAGRHSASADSIDVLHLAYGGLGGHAAVIGPLTEQLSAAGFRSAVITYAPTGELAANAVAWTAADVVIPVPAQSRADLRAQFHIARAVAALRPRVVLCHTHKPTLAVFLGFLLAGRQPRLVLVEHQSLALRRRADDILSAVALLLVRAVVVNQDDYGRGYPLRRLRFPSLRHLFVVPNGVDTTVFAPAPPAPRDEIAVGMASRLMPTKDLTTLVRAFARAASALPDVRLVLRIAGDGPDRDQVEAEVHRLDVVDRVQLLGALHGDELVQFFRDLDIYVQSTMGETACTAVLQAGATGLATIGTDVTGVRELIQDRRNGLLVPVGDVEQMASAMGSLARDPAQRAALGHAARYAVCSSHDVRASATRYREVLHHADPLGLW